MVESQQECQIVLVKLKCDGFSIAVILPFPAMSSLRKHQWGVVVLLFIAFAAGLSVMSEMRRQGAISYESVRAQTIVLPQQGFHSPASVSRSTRSLYHPQHQYTFNKHDRCISSALAAAPKAKLLNNTSKRIGWQASWTTSAAQFDITITPLSYCNQSKLILQYHDPSNGRLTPLSQVDSDSDGSGVGVIGFVYGFTNSSAAGVSCDSKAMLGSTECVAVVHRLVFEYDVGLDGLVAVFVPDKSSSVYGIVLEVSVYDCVIVMMAKTR